LLGLQWNIDELSIELDEGRIKIDGWCINTSLGRWRSVRAFPLLHLLLPLLLLLFLLLLNNNNSANSRLPIPVHRIEWK
jgi:hypothetical protein